MLDEMLTLWRRHERINRYMLDHIPEAGLCAVALLKTGKPSTGRNVARQLAHLVESRAAYMRAAEKELLRGLPVLAKGETPSRAWLEQALAASSAGVEALLTRLVTSGEQLRKSHPLILLGHLIAHESHHRGQVLLALKQSGVSLSEPLRWGIWEQWFKP